MSFPIVRCDSFYKSIHATLGSDIEGDKMEERLLYEKRQWGEYHVLHERVFPDGIGILTKELVIEAGKSISYQRHFHRDEYWTIVDGEGEIIIDGVRQPVKRGDTAIIKKFQLHTIKAISDLTIIETQIGDLLSEDDIERLNFIWEENKFIR